MKTLFFSAASLLVVSTLTAFAQSAPSASAKNSAPQTNPAPSPAAANYGKLPLSFEANRGQADPQVKFLSRGLGYSLLLTDRAAVLALNKSKGENRTDVVRMELDGGGRASSVEGADELAGKSNYYRGHDPAKWLTNVPTYAKVKYAGVYPGIDLVYYGNQRQLEYDFIVAPNADPKPVRLHFAGAEKLSLNADGDLSITAKNGEIAFHKPVVYQSKDGQRQPVEGGFTLLANNTVGFQLGDYDRTRELVIDPTLAYSTYLGPQVTATGIAVDPADEAVMVGTIQSPFYPGLNPPFPITVGPPLPANEFYQGVLIVKLNSAGSALLYSTYLANSTTDAARSAIAVDTGGNAYIAGTTAFPDFVTTPGSFQPTIPSTTKSVGFVTKLDAAGEIAYSTYLGGPNGQAVGSFDGATAIALDSERHAYVTGVTSSFHFPVTADAYQRTDKHPSTETQTGFVSKLSTDGSSLIYSTYLGGSGRGSSYLEDAPLGIAVDSSGSAYVAGFTTSTDFPTTPGAFEALYPSPAASSGFVTKLNPAGSALAYSTYLGGSNSANGESVKAVAIDASSSAYVTGQTTATNFPTTTGAFQTTGVAYSCFVTKFNPDGTALAYSTYLDGSSGDSGSAIAVDSKGHALVTGIDFSTDFPLAGGALIKKAPASTTNGIPFFTELNTTGSGLVYSTYLDGEAASLSTDSGTGVAVDSMDNAYVAGLTGAATFPITGGAFQTVCNQCGAAFVTKFAFNGATETTLESSANPQSPGEEVTFTAHVSQVAGGAPATGLLTFNVDGVSAGHVTLDESGSGSYSSSGLVVGPHTIKANYMGVPATLSGSGAGITETIKGQVATPTFPAVGGTFRLPVFVFIETSSLGATIYYTTDGSMPTTSSPVYTGFLYLTQTTTVRAIAAETGDTTSAVASTTFTIVPTAVFTATALTSSSNPSLLGDSVTFTATVTAASGPTPTGSVTFKNGSAVLGTVPLSGGVASISTSGLSLLGHTIVAIYTGNATDQGSEQTLRQEVDPE